jgi:glycosyl transferase, family 25
MKHIIDFFDRAYIINLSDRADRRREAVREFRRIGVDVPNDVVRFYTATRPTEKGSFPDLGTRGNFTSHRNVLDLAKRDGLRNVLVFEDDISFRSIDPSFEKKLMAQLAREEWDVVLFGYLRPADDDLVGPLAPWHGETMGGHFYAVNGAFIGKMLQYMHDCEARPPGHPDGSPMLADAAYSHARAVMPGMRVFVSVPNLAHQRNSRTDVHPTPAFDKITWLAPFLRGARSIKHKLRMRADEKELLRRAHQPRANQQ